MNKIYQNLMRLLLASVAMTYAGPSAAEFLEDFPALCSEASNQRPLPGHVMKLGFVADTQYGWSFLFPEKGSNGMLERVSILDNAGIIGQPPEQDFGDELRLRTPQGTFVVAHVFVGNQGMEPVVTCVSTPMPLAQYVPTNYGSSWSWLDNAMFGRWLTYRKFGKWKWKRYWNFDKVRFGFDSFWRREGLSKTDRYKKYRKVRNRDRDGDNRRKGTWKNIRRDGSDKLPRRDVRILPVTGDGIKKPITTRPVLDSQKGPNVRPERKMRPGAGKWRVQIKTDGQAVKNPQGSPRVKISISTPTNTGNPQSVRQMNVSSTNMKPAQMPSSRMQTNKKPLDSSAKKFSRDDRVRKNP